MFPVPPMGMPEALRVAPITLMVFGEVAAPEALGLAPEALAPEVLGVTPEAFAPEVLGVAPGALKLREAPEVLVVFGSSILARC